MRPKRTFRRFLRRFDAEFRADGATSRGIASRLSEGGLFIRTHRPLAEGAEVEVTIHPPGMETCRVKGVVKYAHREPTFKDRNGMGMALTEKDRNYEALITRLREKEEGDS
jgi:hypothetical protein